MYIYCAQRYAKVLKGQNKYKFILVKDFKMKQVYQKESHNLRLTYKLFLPGSGNNYKHG